MFWDHRSFEYAAPLLTSSVLVGEERNSNSVPQNTPTSILCLVYSFSEQTFTECLLCARHWGKGSKAVSDLMELTCEQAEGCRETLQLRYTPREGN